MRALTAAHDGALAQLAELGARSEETGAALEAARRREQQLLVEAEVRSTQLEELRQTEATWRERGQADMAERLSLRASSEDASREVARLRELLRSGEEQAKLLRSVNERVRAETSEEHGMRARWLAPERRQLAQLSPPTHATSHYA